MKNQLVFIIVILIGMLIIMGFSINRRENPSNKVVSVQKQAPAPASETDSAPAPQQKTMGAVEVQVTPVRLEANAQPLLKIEMNTHSVELDYDLIKIVQLTDDLGNSYKPLVWNGGSGGHHLTGEITFSELKGDPDTLTLTLSGIDGNTETFTWSLKEVNQT
ncbi:MAG: hypothetical protein A2785_00495 [Candidatus Chisholmbacteria bacterium RIFCSPHIGHO2_01_FULL_49_18]|uniref:DUF4352 domain-containing protein n=2 Tax=Candidatus Chisholmiibacteriota TaxID=1817900 RepID=A0A1G1VPL8_9BACT|nr:MAG: hypothetical protein A2785_00495 [Candidatus Chisholmbacteria bacterium RIFCSPHIGHO2_01_FULL_49_18]OGY21215.1 MAG: hypothetical protein A3A65_05740 [Candidatus Chisholmbacteria bacterium RIFCSPLOWO2_01_FULL_49_14]